VPVSAEKEDLLHTGIYQDLAPLASFTQVCELSSYSELPDEWHVIVADIANSTIAIQSGQYKAVNLVGVSIISAILNISDNVEIPYIFGGDGASLCIPPELLEQSRLALIATRQLAREEFSLELRVGIVAIRQIRLAGKRMLCTKHRVSEYCTQAAFAGGGIEYAEYLLKSDSNDIDRLVTDTELPATANYSGLECRWDNVPSRHGETISLIVRSLAPILQEQVDFYKEVIEQVRHIYGDDQICKPVTSAGLSMTFDGNKLSLENRLKTHGKGQYDRIRNWMIIRLQNVLGWVLMHFGLKTAGVDWGNYKSDLEKNTDFRKFDGVLRQVLSGTASQREKLDRYLQEQFASNQCVYGIHHSESALITCLISNRSGNHYHFIDGADGGYALAATAMKQQLKLIMQ